MVMPNNTLITGIILAGGKNSRMGYEKALLQIGGRRIIEVVSSMLRQLTREVLIVSGNEDIYFPYCDRVVKDIEPGRGPIGGIYTGLVSASSDRSLVVACDMPFVSLSLGRLLAGATDGYDIVVPKYRGYPEPLFAVYSKTCIEPICKQIARCDYRVTGFYKDMRVKYIEEDMMRQVESQLERAFFNVNTPADLEKARAMV